MPPHAFHQRAEHRLAGGIVPQVLVHGDPGIQAQRVMLGAAGGIGEIGRAEISFSLETPGMYWAILPMSEGSAGLSGFCVRWRAQSMAICAIWVRGLSTPRISWLIICGNCQTSDKTSVNCRKVNPAVFNWARPVRLARPDSNSAIASVGSSGAKCQSSNSPVSESRVAREISSGEASARKFDQARAMLDAMTAVDTAAFQPG
nr:hypothetical protein [Chromobacterium violaceum]